METFINYLLKEYKLPNEVVCHKVSFTHSIKYKADKKSDELIPFHIINMKIQCYDKNHNLINTFNEKFINDMIIRNKNKKLQIIKEDEINKLFSLSKKDICNLILADLCIKNEEFVKKIKDLLSYKGELKETEEEDD